MTILSEEQILQKYNADSLKGVINIDFWGCGIEDIGVIERMVDAEIISFSVNKISSLKPFSGLLKLKELYLRKNHIESIKELNHLTELKELKVLWLSENPICSQRNYRLMVIRKLPQLVKLDNVPISKEEREKAATMRVYRLERSSNSTKLEIFEKKNEIFNATINFNPHTTVKNASTIDCEVNESKVDDKADRIFKKVNFKSSVRNNQSSLRKDTVFSTNTHKTEAFRFVPFSPLARQTSNTFLAVKQLIRDLNQDELVKLKKDIEIKLSN